MVFCSSPVVSSNGQWSVRCSSYCSARLGGLGLDLLDGGRRGMTIEEVVFRIEKLNSGLASFWAASNGWAPVEAAGLLTKSRLDWQTSLSTTLRLWLREPATALSDGELILAWSNLGSLVEGTLKLLLSVFYMDYKQDVDSL